MSKINWTVSESDKLEFKTFLVIAPLLHPQNYHRDYSLYLVAAFSMISMVMVQDDDDGGATRVMLCD